MQDVGQRECPAVGWRLAGFVANLDKPVRLLEQLTATDQTSTGRAEEHVVDVVCLGFSSQT
jgi:hypothetical protein